MVPKDVRDEIMVPKNGENMMEKDEVMVSINCEMTQVDKSYGINEEDMEPNGEVMELEDHVMILKRKQGCSVIKRFCGVNGRNYG
ncbi:hypothetical protein X798_08226 [Onchocerca flexuosa]|uniref:Reverse transcriptase domain-containing protein n=2 Tax=Onchocerca flexuosa TaxID=387005 RepID=A0A183H9Z4_9BILA|nr:hypothetical protein X798_08226 [Onchocerca flexuosa]VDO39579.1 unnamed protein product [Onchocerca flexuosa]